MFEKSSSVEKMPSLCAKQDKVIVSDNAESTLRQCLTVVEKKVRNLEKRKTKLDSYQASDVELNADQKEAVAKYEVVQQNLEFARDLHKQFITMLAESEKVSRKQAKREKVERQQYEVLRLRMLLRLDVVVAGLSHDEVKSSFLAEQRDSAVITEERVDQLRAFGALIMPCEDLSNVQKLDEAAEHIVAFLDARDMPVVGTTYKNLNDTLDMIVSTGYFSRPTKVSGAVAHGGTVVKETAVVKDNAVAMHNCCNYKDEELPADQLGRSINDQEIAERLKSPLSSPSSLSTTSAISHISSPVPVANGNGAYEHDSAAGRLSSSATGKKPASCNGLPAMAESKVTINGFGKAGTSSAAASTSSSDSMHEAGLKKGESILASVRDPSTATPKPKVLVVDTQRTGDVMPMTGDDGLTVPGRVNVAIETDPEVNTNTVNTEFSTRSELLETQLSSEETRSAEKTMSDTSLSYKFETLPVSSSYKSSDVAYYTQPKVPEEIVSSLCGDFNFLQDSVLENQENDRVYNYICGEDSHSQENTVNENQMYVNGSSNSCYVMDYSCAQSSSQQTFSYDGCHGDDTTAPSGQMGGVYTESFVPSCIKSEPHDVALSEIPCVEQTYDVATTYAVCGAGYVSAINCATSAADYTVASQPSHVAFHNDYHTPMMTAAAVPYVAPLVQADQFLVHQPGVGYGHQVAYTTAYGSVMPIYTQPMMSNVGHGIEQVHVPTIEPSLPVETYTMMDAQADYEVNEVYHTHDGYSAADGMEFDGNGYYMYDGQDKCQLNPHANEFRSRFANTTPSPVMTPCATPTEQLSSQDGTEYDEGGDMVSEFPYRGRGGRYWRGGQRGTGFYNGGRGFNNVRFRGNYRQHDSSCANDDGYTNGSNECSNHYNNGSWRGAQRGFRGRMMNGFRGGRGFVRNTTYSSYDSSADSYND